MAIGDRSVAEILQDVLRNLQQIVRSEVRLAKTEVREEVIKAKSAAVFIAGGALCGIFAVFSLLLASVYGLTLVVPNWAAALIVTAVLTAVAAMTTLAGLKQLKRIHPAPAKTVETMKENVAWAKQQVKLENYIDQKRDDLGSNLKELEGKVRGMTDWRQQYQKSPLTAVAIAFGGGIVLASMLAGKSNGRSRNAISRESDAPHAGTDHQTYKALETWDNIKGALIGVAATRFKDFVGEIIPGFQEQLRTTEYATKEREL